MAPRERLNQVQVLVGEQQDLRERPRVPLPTQALRQALEPARVDRREQLGQGRGQPLEALTLVVRRDLVEERSGPHRGRGANQVELVRIGQAAPPCPT